MALRQGDRPVRDDRVLAGTRILAYAIVPFLVLGFAVLYPWPGDTGRLFAWHIGSRFTAMALGSAYAGGAYFFVRAARATAWHTVKGGFVPVAVFAALLGIATVLHWPVFDHHRVAFWIWTALYFTTPFLVVAVWWRNRRHDVPAGPDDPVLPRAAVRVLAAVGALAVVTGAVLFLRPAAVLGWWPWPLTPLTARVLGAVFCLGLAGLGAVADARWSSARLPLQVALVMLVLMLVAAARAAGEFTGGAVTAVFGTGFAAVTLAAAALYGRLRRTAWR